MVNPTGFSLLDATVKMNRGTIMCWCIIYQPMASYTSHVFGPLLHVGYRVGILRPAPSVDRCGHTATVPTMRHGRRRSGRQLQRHRRRPNGHPIGRCLKMLLAFSVQYALQKICFHLGCRHISLGSLSMTCPSTHLSSAFSNSTAIRCGLCPVHALGF